MIEALFMCLIVRRSAVIVAHDLVDIPGWVHGSQVQAMMGKRKVWLATLANAALPGTAAAFAIWFWAHPKPAFVTNYWVIYCLIALLSAVGVWYVPYFLGAQEKQKKIPGDVCRDSSGAAGSWRPSAPGHVPYWNPCLVSCHFQLGADCSVQMTLPRAKARGAYRLLMGLDSRR